MTDKFPSTHWSIILAAQGGENPVSRRALSDLCETYWPPVYAFIRHRGHSPDEAADLTQAFFTQFLEREALTKVDPAAGRFRSFLLTSVRNMLSDRLRHDRALKRGSGKRLLSLDVLMAEQRLQPSGAADLSPEGLFERQWAVTVIEKALKRLDAEFATNGDERRYHRLKPYLTGETPKQPYQEVATELGISVDACKTAVYRLRRRFGRIMRSEVAHTVPTRVDVSEEVRYLLEILRR